MLLFGFTMADVKTEACLRIQEGRS